MATRRASVFILAALLLHGAPVRADESGKRGAEADEAASGGRRGGGSSAADGAQGRASSARGTVGDYSDTGGTPGSPSEPRGASSAPRQERLLDVEELNDNVERYVAQQVSVAGEIQEWLDPRSFVLESGGIFDDEIAVVVPRNAKGIDASTLAEDADIVVSGTVRQATLVEIERELGWDLRPEFEVEFGGTRTYLVAHRITRQQDGGRAQSRGSGSEGRGGGGEAAVGDFSDTGATPGSPSEPSSGGRAR